MSCARPVVATDVGGVKEALDGFGVIVKPRDANAFGQGVIKLLKDEETRQNMGRLAREEVILKFKISTSIDQYLNAYQSFAYQKNGNHVEKTKNIDKNIQMTMSEPKLAVGWGA